MNEQSQLKRFVFPMALSLMVHWGVLLQLHVGHAHVRADEPHRFTVSLSPVEPEEKRHQPRLPAEKAELRREMDHPAISAETASTLDAAEGGYHLDMNRIRSQAREFAKQELATYKPVRTVSGDYSGVYSGDDCGVFFFHLDDSGHASGSGQSDTYGIAFLIEGEVLPDGGIRMIGSRKEGESKFQGSLSGTLDRRNGKVSGSWSVSTRLSLKGTFVGGRES